MDDLARLTRWLRQQALPLWAEAGYDHRRHVFAERLGFDGKPVEGLPHRLIVQARQIAVFAQAERHGAFSGAGGMAVDAANRMIADYAGKGANGGWAFSTNGEGGIIDAREDLYSHAFALFALAHCHALDGKTRWLETADETLAFLDARFATPGGGFAPALPWPQERLQNPVMHLFEALLALFEASGQERFGACADALRTFACTHFVSPQSGGLLERFDDSWTMSTDAIGTWAEGGHQYEWIWLLDRSERLIGGDMGAAITSLHRFATRNCLDAEGYVVDENEASGTIRKPARRLWPQTEALRCELVLEHRGDTSAQVRARAHARCLREGFLIPAPPGGWIDRIDVDRAHLSPDMPASSLYHLAGAIFAIEDARP